MRTTALTLALLAFAAGCSHHPEPAGAAPSASAAPSGQAALDEGAPHGLTKQAFAAAAALRDATLARSGALETVRSLTDEVGPRLAGSPGDKAAVAWALRTMPALGLKDVHAEAVQAPHWERGLATADVIAPVAQGLAVAALGGSVATPAGGLEAEVVEVASFAALDGLAEADARGKIVFIDQPTERTRDFGGYGRAVGARARGPARAAKLGAVAVVIRSIGTDDNRLPHTGLTVYEEGTPKIPAAALAGPDASLLHRLIERRGSGPAVRLRLRLGARTLPPSPTANVVGEVRGGERAGEIVLLGAHLDSWDLGTGAVDDGAGCAIVLEAARQIAALPTPPARTVRVVLFANEENGMAGAKGYALAHANEISAHVLMMEADEGAGRVYATRYRGAESGAPAFLDVAALVGPLGAKPLEGDADGGTDLLPLRALGVPIVDLRQDGSGYFDLHHTANDTFDKIAKADLDQAAASYAAAAYAAASFAGGFGRAVTTPELPGH